MRAESSEGLYEVSNLFYQNEGLRPPISVLSSIRVFIILSRHHYHPPLTALITQHLEPAR